MSELSDQERREIQSLLRSKFEARIEAIRKEKQAEFDAMVSKHNWTGVNRAKSSDLLKLKNAKAKSERANAYFRRLRDQISRKWGVSTQLYGESTLEQQVTDAAEEKAHDELAATPWMQEINRLEQLKEQVDDATTFMVTTGDALVLLHATQDAIGKPRNPLLS